MAVVTEIQATMSKATITAKTKLEWETRLSDYWATVTSLDPCVQYVPPTNVLASRQFYHNYPALSPANLAGTAAEIGFGLATGPVVDSVIIGGAEGLLGAGAALYAGTLVKGSQYGKLTGDVVRGAQAAERINNVVDPMASSRPLTKAQQLFLNKQQGQSN